MLTEGSFKHTQHMSIRNKLYSNLYHSKGLSLPGNEVKSRGCWGGGGFSPPLLQKK